MIFPTGLNNNTGGVYAPDHQSTSPQAMPQNGPHPVMQGPGGPPVYFMPTGQPYHGPLMTSHLPPNALNRDQIYQWVLPQQPPGTHFIPAPGHFPTMNTYPNMPPPYPQQPQAPLPYAPPHSPQIAKPVSDTHVNNALPVAHNPPSASASVTTALSSKPSSTAAQAAAFKSASTPAKKGLQKDLISGQRRTNTDSKTEATGAAKPAQKGALGWIRAKANAFGSEVKALGRCIQKNASNILGALGITTIGAGFVVGVALVGVGLGTGAFPLLLAGIIILTPYAIAALVAAPASATALL